MCYKILNSEVSLNCIFFDLSALTHTRGHKYKLYKKQSSINAYKYFSVIEFVTFGMLYPILCLMCHLLIILEDCLIKLIFLSLQFCCDCLLLLFCWAYSMFMFYVHIH